ncbi:MAG: sulfatase-like hydrolase/transferase [Limisphaerales bacterium]
MRTRLTAAISPATYVIFTTDNGPWRGFKHHAGSAGPLRDGKMSTFEGGQRVPCIMWAPGHIPAGTVCEALASTMDLLPTIPTIAAITGTPLPAGRAIDGVDISALLKGDARSVRNEFLYYARNGSIEDIREGDWKLLVQQPEGENGPKPSAPPQVMLFNLVDDLGEQHNLAAEKPGLVERLRQRMLELDAAVEAGARPAWKKSGDHQP